MHKNNLVPLSLCNLITYINNKNKERSTSRYVLWWEIMSKFVALIKQFISKEGFKAFLGNKLAVGITAGTLVVTPIVGTVVYTNIAHANEKPVVVQAVPEVAQTEVKKEEPKATEVKKEEPKSEEVVEGTC